MEKKDKGKSERKRKEREREKGRQRNGKNNRIKERGENIEKGERSAPKGREGGSRERLTLDQGYCIHQYQTGVIVYISI